MGIINVIANIKKIHPEDIVLIKLGKFYYVYGKDAYIISYIFGYKLMKIEQYNNMFSCAFPSQSYAKVISKLERHKINYIIVDRKNNYDVEEKSNNKNLNTYSDYFEKAKKYINAKIRIDNIYKFLIENLENEEIKPKIREMEEIINEARKL